MTLSSVNLCSILHSSAFGSRLNELLDFQVLEPLRAMVAGSPLEDARHLAQRYSKMRQEAEIQVTVTIISFAKDCMINVC